MSIRSKIPWWGKIAIKLILSRLPIEYELWKKISLFHHGSMEQPNYAFGVFKKHFERIKLRPGFVSLELGPGDSLFSALTSWSLGGSSSYLVDNGNFALKDIHPYKAMAQFLIEKGLPAPAISDLHTLDEILKCCSATYMTSGLSSLQTVPDESVDFIWSHAVLEHIKRSDFIDTIQELRRVMRSGGNCSHRVDLRDHLDGALNNLRFRDRLWDSDFMAKSGFYTNRIRCSEMLALFQKAGFNVEILSIDRWDRLPTPKSRLSFPFSHLPDDELCVWGFDVILRPA